MRPAKALTFRRPTVFSVQCEPPKAVQSLKEGRVFGTGAWAQTRVPPAPSLGLGREGFCRWPPTRPGPGSSQDGRRRLFRGGGVAL